MLRDSAAVAEFAAFLEKENGLKHKSPTTANDAYRLLNVTDPNFLAAYIDSGRSLLDRNIRRQSTKQHQIEDGWIGRHKLHHISQHSHHTVMELDLSIPTNAIQRSLQTNYTNNMGLSFDTISAFGSNAAIIHYSPTPETDAVIDTTSVYMVDSGGQYLDGTTDVTRTFHYGTPTDVIKEAYTRVLMGQIELAQTVWPQGLYGSELDIRARVPLYQNGWNYNHGTGHGIGYFLSVHEGPAGIGRGNNKSPLYDGMFMSDEPGYYEDNDYGIRLENLVEVVVINTTYHFGSSPYIGFEPRTLVPYEPTLIKYELLSNTQKSWLEAYNARCLNEVGQYLLSVRNNQEAYDWVAARTGPIPAV